MNIKIVTLLLSFCFILAACLPQAPLETADEQPLPEKKTTEEKTISTDDVILHNNAKDCWLIIGSKVYDVTQFITTHPGGKTIIEGCGKDATQIFETRPMGSGTPHSSRARDLLKDYYLGELK